MRPDACRAAGRRRLPTREPCLPAAHRLLFASRPAAGPASRSMLAAAAFVVTVPPPASLAQTMPGPVYHELAGAGHGKLARDISRHLDLRGNPNRVDVERLLQRWRRETGGPRSGYDWLAVARLWLRADQPEPAREALERTTGRIPDGLYLLERARVAFLEGDRAGATLYWRACEVADETSALEAWLDVEILATPGELAAWDRFRRLPAPERDDCGFLRRFWNRRAVASGVGVDRRIEQHYERVRYALERYRRRGKEGPLFSARLGRPRNPAFDDRGLLYVRMGAPEETASFLGGGATVQSNVTWAYRYPDGSRLYHLSPLGGTDNWWLLENLAQVIGTAPTHLLGQIQSVGLLSELYLSRMSLDVVYGHIAYRAARAGGDRLQRLRIVEDLMDERGRTWEDGTFAVRGVPERPAVDLSTHFGVEWLQFRAPEMGLTRVWLNGMVATDGLRPEPLARGDRRFRLEAVWALLDESETVYRRFPTELSLDAARGADDPSGIAVRAPADLPPGTYRTVLVVRDLVGDLEGADERKRGGYSADSLVVRSLGGAVPLLSDVAVAADSGGSWSPDGLVSLQPVPAHSTGADGVGYVYYEAYNLTPGGGYVTDVLLEPAAEGEPFQLTFRGSVPAAGQLHGFLRLDLTDTEAGDYRMAITVRDVASGATTLPRVTHIVVSPDSRAGR